MRIELMDNPEGEKSSIV